MVDDRMEYMNLVMTAAVIFLAIMVNNVIVRSFGNYVTIKEWAKVGISAVVVAAMATGILLLFHGSNN